MSYQLYWRSPALQFIQKQTPITVAAGAVVSDQASLRFTGKGAANYGKIQQENLLRLLENFAGPTAPDYPTVGQAWYDTTNSVLKVCVSTAPYNLIWQQLNSTQITNIGDPPPTPVVLGETWFQRTGSASGVLYVYTGIGRFPQTNWSASTSGYWPTTSTTLTADLNTTSFGGALNYNEAYIHGFTGSTSADVNGSILINGTTTVVPKGPLFTQYPVNNGLVVWDTTATLVSGSNVFFSVRQTQDNRWFYDNNSVWVEFTPVAGMWTIGTLTVGGVDTGASPGTPPGIIALTLWSTAKALTATKQVPATLANGAIGGWEQVWPAPETVGGRLEYDQLFGLLAQLIGDAEIYGGSGALSKSVQFLTDFRTLDASMEQAWGALMPNDVTALGPGQPVNALRVDPTSQDWDALLAACRYAVNRLELPSAAVGDLSQYPFVLDGLPVSPALSGFVLPDVRTPPASRGTRTKPGLLTLIGGYQATGNVLQAAVAQRYVIKGLLEGSGSGNTYNSTVTTSNQASFNGNATSFSGTVTHGLQFNFSTLENAEAEFFFSGAALQLVMAHQPTGSTASDATLKAITDGFGRIRITADTTYVMTPSPTPTLALAPIPIGYLNLTSSTTLATLTSGGSTIVIRIGYVSPGSLAVYIDITAGGSVTGAFNVLWSYISDKETYGSPAVNVYPQPAAYASTDKLGSATFN